MNAAIAAQPRATRALECPACGGAIELHAAGYSMLHVCQYCGSEIDLVDDQAKLIAQHVEAAKDLTLPLGTKGQLNGVDWVCVGNLEKHDGWGGWEEFLLFNPYHGYRWLVLTPSGWSFCTPILSNPARPSQDSFRFEGTRMKRIFDPAASLVGRAIGEFYWRVKKGDEVVSTSYLGGGRVLSCEMTGDEYNWTLEEFIPSAAVAQAFGIEDTGQYPQIGDYPQPHQPNPHTDRLVNWGLIAGIAFFAALLLSIVLSFGGERREETFIANPSSSARSFSLGRFEVTGRARPFTITARGEPGDNNWMYLEYTLTDTKTDEEIIAGQSIEYYYGRDWKEDDRSGTIKIASVPPGTYELSAEIALPEDEARAGSARAPSARGWGASGSVNRPVTVEVTSNGLFYSNLFLLFLALFAPVIWIGFAAASFESARASNFDGGEDDDD